MKRAVNPLPGMKNNGEKDPLNEKEFKEKQEKKRQKKTLREENQKENESFSKENENEPAVHPSVDDISQSGPVTPAFTDKPAEPDQPTESPVSETADKPPEPDQPTESPVSEAADKPPEPDTVAGEGKTAGAELSLEAEQPSAEAEQPAESARSKSTARPRKKAPPSDDSLVDDNEERQSYEPYDDEVDHDDHHEEPEEEERVNYSLLSKEDLVKLLSEKLDNPGKGNFRRDVEEIKQAFFEKQHAAVEEKRKHFLDEGGNLEDFKPAEDPLEAEMKELVGKYRGMKAEYTKQLEKTKQENLLKKQEILEELRILMEGQESFEVTFRKFKDLQRQWFAAGVVPQQNLKDLWDSYNYYVDKFNDYVRINRELRALDLKKNLELKMQLCERTEELDREPNIVHAFKTLQKYHTRWREIGPVPRENRDEVWDRFKQATSVINRKHQEYHSRLKESLYDNLEKKTALCEKVEAIAEKKYETHGAWVERTNQVLEIQKSWKSIGYAPKKDNNAIYARFRRACDTFFSNKASYYSAAYEEQKDNLKLKIEIAEKAESLSNSQDWKDTTTELIRLQKQWKEIGPVPRKDSDKLWKRFRTACDTFFSNKSKYFEDIDSTFDDNLKAKEGLVAEMDAYAPVSARKKNLEMLENFQARFDEIGYVPSAKKDWIKEQFRQAQDRMLERMGLDESERSIFRFRNRIKGIIQAPRADMKLSFERDKLLNKLQQLRNDIGVWENNVGFFKQSKSSDDTIQGFHDKIESARTRIAVLEEKIRILDHMENEN